MPEGPDLLPEGNGGVVGILGVVFFFRRREEETSGGGGGVGPELFEGRVVEDVAVGGGVGHEEVKGRVARADDCDWARDDGRAVEVG